jgi:hypothetical protein
MSIATLYNRIDGQPEVTLDEAGLGADGGWLFPQLSTLSATLITLVVTQGPTWTDSNNTQFSITGTAKEPLLGMTSPTMVLVAEVVNTAVHFQLRITTVANWTLGQSYPKLAMTELDLLVFSQPPTFIVSTRDDATDELQTGLNLSGQLQVEGPIAQVLEFIPGASNPLALSGTITQQEGQQVFILRALATSSTPTLALPGWVTFQFPNPGLALYAYVYDNNAGVVIQKAIESEVVIAGNGHTSVPIPLALQLPSVVTGWQLMLQPGREVSLADFITFLSLLGSAGQFDLTSYFTDSSGILDRVKTVLQAIQLKQFYVALSTSISSPSFQSFGFEIGSEGNSWEIIPGTLALGDLDVFLQTSKTDSTWSTAGFIRGDVELDAGIDIRAHVPLPIGSGMWQFTMRHAVPLSSFNILSKFTEGSPIDALLPTSLSSVGGLELQSLNLLFDPSVPSIKQLDFEVQSTDPWVIIQDEFVIESIYLSLIIARGTSGWGLSGIVQGRLLAGGIEFFTGVSKATPEADWFFNAHANQIPLPTLEDLAKLTGGENALTDALPSSLLTAELYLDNPYIDFNLSQTKLQAFGFSLTTEQLDFDSFQVVKAGVQANIEFGVGREIKVYGSFLLSDIDFGVQCAYNSTDGWDISGYAAMNTAIEIGDLITKLAAHFGIASDVPAVLSGLSISDIQLDYKTLSKDFSFSFATQFPIGSKTLDANISIAITHNNGQYSRTFSGIIHVGGLEFDLIFQQDQGADTLFVAAFENPSGQDQSIAPLVALITDNADMLDAAAGITFNLKNALLVIDKGASSKLLFGLDIGGGIDISNLPLVGKMLPDNAVVKVALQPLLTSADFTEAELTRVRALVPTGGYQLPKEAKERLGLNIQLVIGDEKIDLSLPIVADDVKTQPATSTLPATTSASTGSTTAAPPAASDGIKWFSIQKQLGPIKFSRAGVQFKDSQLYLLLDTSLTLASLTISLDGLFVSSTLSPIHPKFGLHGLGIDYKNGPLEIGGAFLRQTFTDSNGAVYDTYDGTAIIKAQSFSLAALGSYAFYQGHPSLFLYAFVDTPLGGPAFFFVTGLAAGFGYNRRVIVPGIDGVKNFPLVAEALAGVPGTTNDLGAELAKLHNVIPPAVGEYFLAVGVRFTSFEIIDSFVLLTLSFGQSFEVDVLGLSTLVVPKPEQGSSVTPLAEVQMALKAVFNPDKGFLKVEAALTSASYFLSKDCHLTGGFAFYTWFKDNPAEGAPAGDFVLTLGGYHPRFTPPAHYPKVAPLGFNWRVTSELVIKGDCYFALVPSAVMAGGHLSATWESGSIKAWFEVGADFIISWKPYFYDATMHVSMGVSYTYHFFGKHHISVHVGADLHIWGPKFSGKASVHLWIVSFTVRFGSNSSETPPALSWDQFRKGFLPPLAKWANVNVTNGLVRKLGTDEDPLYIVNPKDFSMETASALPATTSNHSLGSSNTHINIGSMKITNNDVTIRHAVTISRDATDVTADFTFTPVQKHVPGALWGTKFKHSENESENERLVKNACTGFVITGKAPTPSGITHDVASDKLLNEEESFGKQITYGAAVALGGAWLKTSGVRDKVSTEIEATDATRATLLQAMGFLDSYQPQHALADEFILTAL